MDKLNYLYEIAEENNVKVHYPRIGHFKSMIIKNKTSADILLDMKRIETSVEEKECLAHEIGHFAIGTYYTVNTKYETVKRREYRVDRWAVRELLPFCHLKKALLAGHTEAWELAEYFDLSEEFIKKALYIYECQGLLPIRDEAE